MARFAAGGARSAPTVRTVEVAPPSLGDELTWLFLAATAVLVVVIYVVAFETYGTGRSDPASAARSLLPFQVLFKDLPGGEQRVFRAMQEGAGEAVRARGESGSWPSVASLSDAGVPPFAPDPLDKARRQWSERREGLVVNYLGVPSSADGAPLFLILAQEPDPVTGEKPPPPSVVDEEHQLLPDGTLLHVTYWKRAGGDVRPGIIGDPAIAGWQQIRVTSPAEEMDRWRDRLFRDS
ncbi:MAG TPA: hypothetical protein VMS22_13800 [Candidatus Eisenbacteria bacterium]|nr:hypothetical protein [Candidatus Eisenbacteria bacterium]